MKKPLISVLVYSVFLVGIFYLLNLRVSQSSSDIEYAPGAPIAKTEFKTSSTKPRNIILFIADGMGFSHLSLAMHTQQNENKPSVWQEFDVKGWHDSKSTYGPLTDSGASATAMATGTPTFWDMIGQDPDGTRLTSVFEVAAEQGFRVGAVM